MSRFALLRDPLPAIRAAKQGRMRKRFRCLRPNAYPKPGRFRYNCTNCTNTGHTLIIPWISTDTATTATTGPLVWRVTKERW